MNSLGFSGDKIISCVNTASFVFPIPVLIHFISFSCLAALVRTSSTVLNRSGKKEHPYHVLYFFCSWSFSFIISWCWLRVFHKQLYLFSVATVTNCNKLDALKQHAFIIFQFYILGVQHELHQAKTKVSDGLFSILLNLGESSLPLPTSKGHSQYLAHGPLSPFSKLAQWHLSHFFFYSEKALPLAEYIRNGSLF